MEHNIKLHSTSNEQSNWVEKNIDSIVYTISTKPLEEKNITKLVDNILNEFNHTNEELKEVFKEQLLTWLKSSSDVSNSGEEVKEVRDFIYEMF